MFPFNFKALQDHPELQYAPSKKKGPKKAIDGSVKGGIQQQSLADSSSLKSCTATPEASRSTTPNRGAANLIAPQRKLFKKIIFKNLFLAITQNQVFSPFQCLFFLFFLSYLNWEIHFLVFPSQIQSLQ